LLKELDKKLEIVNQSEDKQDELMSDLRAIITSDSRQLRNSSSDGGRFSLWAIFEPLVGVGKPE
jgi:predicted site-specific integrase-resolvase